ncbi:phasin family protein [Sphingomonas phyllosphaerae]|jgi:cytosine/adenosine deaminase-related metal-dependent hydrolase|uniref:phasin family protein n=1 Tax=Sphingomonas phyllosphaerae TaxID=257003 RepID=UPI0003B70960|nr:phasin family protein [Sphingomonas phyllosphaerae]
MTDNRNDMGRAAADAAQKATDQIRQSGQHMMESGSTISTKILDQVETNTQQAFAAMRAAAQAKDLSQVMQIQSDYLQTQGQRSMEQAREIGQLIMQFGRAAVAPGNSGDPSA